MIKFTSSFFSLLAKKKINIDNLIKELLNNTKSNKINQTSTIVTNSRHYEALEKSSKSLMKIKKGLSDNIETDLITIDIRSALHHLGEITGEITTDDLLDNIFRNFCIGK